MEGERAELEAALGRERAAKLEKAREVDALSGRVEALARRAGLRLRAATGARPSDADLSLIHISEPTRPN